MVMARVADGGDGDGGADARVLGCPEGGEGKPRHKLRMLSCE